MAANFTILFDGECHVCSGAVSFIVKRDPRGCFQFACLQSGIGQHLCQQAGFASESLDSMVVLADGHAWTESDAVLVIVRHLRGLWPMLTVFRIVPRGLRNALYRWFARHRYRWFGRRSTCMVPTDDLRKRFLTEQEINVASRGRNSACDQTPRS